MTSWRGLGEAVKAHPDGRSTASRLVATAERVGYDGVVLRNAHRLPDSPSIVDIRDAEGIDVVHGVELSDGIDAVSGRLPHLRRQTSILMVAGGTEERNRFVAAQEHVDVLTSPIGPDGPDIDPGVATDAQAHGVAIEIDLGPLRARGGQRVRYIDRLRRLWRVIDHEDLPYVVTATPSTHLELVAPRELAALADTVGIDADAARDGLAAWLDIAARNRERFGEGFLDGAD